MWVGVEVEVVVVVEEEEDLERADWARMAARKLKKKGRLVVGIFLVVGCGGVWRRPARVGARERIQEGVVRKVWGFLRVVAGGFLLSEAFQMSDIRTRAN